MEKYEFVTHILSTLSFICSFSYSTNICAYYVPGIMPGCKDKWCIRQSVASAFIKLSTYEGDRTQTSKEVYRCEAMV